MSHKSVWIQDSGSFDSSPTGSGKGRKLPCSKKIINKKPKVTTPVSYSSNTRRASFILICLLTEVACETGSWVWELKVVSLLKDWIIFIVVCLNLVLMLASQDWRRSPVAPRCTIENMYLVRALSWEDTIFTKVNPKWTDQTEYFLESVWACVFWLITMAPLSAVVSFWTEIMLYL